MGEVPKTIKENISVDSGNEASSEDSNDSTTQDSTTRSSMPGGCGGKKSGSQSGNFSASDSRRNSFSGLDGLKELKKIGVCGTNSNTSSTRGRPCNNTNMGRKELRGLGACAAVDSQLLQDIKPEEVTASWSGGEQSMFRVLWRVLQALPPG